MYTEFFLLDILNQKKLEIYALLLACLPAMKEEGYAYAVIGRVASDDFYAHLVGAIVIPAPAPGTFRGKLR